MNDNSLQNLKKGVRFGEGQSRKGNGRPKGKSLNTILKEILSEDFSEFSDDFPEGMEGNYAVALELIGIAFSKNHKDKLGAIKEILNRVDGRVTQTVETSLKGSIPLERWVEPEKT
ncbi:MAG: hypothetical protein AAFO07_32160 [Bacteroidota bacterium]